MDACMNKEQQYPEDQQTEKSTMENTKEQECVHTAQKYIEISSDSSSSSFSYDLFKTFLDNSSDSGTRQKTTNPVTSSNKSSTFTAKHNTLETTSSGRLHFETKNSRNIQVITYKVWLLVYWTYIRASYSLVKPMRNSRC